MRKTLGICVAASVAFWLTGCGDDDSVCISCDKADSAATDTDSDDTESDTDKSSSTGNTSSTQSSSTGDEGDSGSITIEAGSSDPDGGATDAGGSDAGTDAEAPETDGGGAGEDAGDAGPVESDAGDGGGSSLTPCQQACETALQAECEDYSTCEADICFIRDVAPNCTAEADAYFECIAATNGAESFECNDDGKPEFTSEECDEQYFIPWVICSGS